MRSYLDLSDNEVEHAPVLYRGSIIIDVSIVAFIAPKDEYIRPQDIPRSSVTESNTKVCT